MEVKRNRLAEIIAENNGQISPAVMKEKELRELIASQMMDFIRDKLTEIVEAAVEKSMAKYYPFRPITNPTPPQQQPYQDRDNIYRGPTGTWTISSTSGTTFPVNPTVGQIYREASSNASWVYTANNQWYNVRDNQLIADVDHYNA